jgi:hypothetical protein
MMHVTPPKPCVADCRYDGLTEDLKGLDWPALRLAIKAIVKDKLNLPPPGTASPVGTPGAWFTSCSRGAPKAGKDRSS